MVNPTATLHRTMQGSKFGQAPAGVGSLRRRPDAVVDRRPRKGRRSDAVLLELYRAATSMAPERFNDTAIELLRTLIEFDAAWWGQMQIEPALVMQGAHRYNVAATIFDDYRRMVGEDMLAKGMVEAPGLTLMMNGLHQRDDLEAQGGGLREYLRRYRVEAVLATGLHGLLPGAPAGFMTIWRFDRRWPFSEADRLVKQSLYPHLIEAQRVNRLLNLESGPRLDNAWALADGSGHLSEVGADFIQTLRAEWPDWQGTMLPGALARRMGGCADFAGRKIQVSVTPAGDLQLLRARSSNPGDRLGKREREVALAFASGESYASIALRLDLAPSTVRTHLQRIYRKLDVHTKSELSLVFR